MGRGFNNEFFGGFQMTEASEVILESIPHLTQYIKKDIKDYLNAVRKIYS